MKQLRFSSFRQRLNAAFLAVSLVPEHLQNRQAVESQAKPELSTRVRHVLWPSRRAGALLL